MTHTRSIQSVVEETGVSAHTLRYYERIGILSVGRDSGGRRAYTNEDVGWVRFVSLLKATAMPLSEIARFVALEAEPTETLAKRREILALHRERLRERIAQLGEYMVALEQKIDYYAQPDDALVDCVDPGKEAR